MIPPSIAVTVPTWKRGEMFDKCVRSLLEQDYTGHIEIMCVCDYQPETETYGDFTMIYTTDQMIAEKLQALATKGGFAGLRSVRIKRGPGRSNWRPGAIHFPVFEHWLQTKCEFVTYQFSDEWSGPTRFREQVDAIRLQARLWSHLPLVDVVSVDEKPMRVNSYRWDPRRIPTNQLMTPSILIDRVPFERFGGLDYPFHAAAKAEEWIQTHCGLLGDPAVPIVGTGRYFFREHRESLGHAHGPGSDVYKESVAETGWVEDDHWRLWNHIQYEYATRVARARTLGT